MKIKKAIILSAGFGKRMRPLTLTTPKPLLKIGSKTLLSNTIDVLQKFGIKEIFINTHYLAEQIKSFIKNNKFQSKITLVEEKKTILNTGGGIMNLSTRLGKNPFLVLNPDTIWNKNYIKDFDNMFKIFLKQNCKCILLVVKKDRSFDQTFSGDFNLKKNFIHRDKKKKSFIYTGAQILTKSVFKKHKIKNFSMNEIWNDLILEKTLRGFESKNKFFHISNVAVYKKIVKNLKIK